MMLVYIFLIYKQTVSLKKLLGLLHAWGVEKIDTMERVIRF